MLMLIHFLSFWEISFKENIGKPFCKIRVQSEQRFLQIELDNIKVLPVT